MYTDIARVTLGDFDTLTDEEIEKYRVYRITWSYKGNKSQGYRKQRAACDVECMEEALADLIRDMMREKCHDIKIDGRKI